MNRAPCKVPAGIIESCAKEYTLRRAEGRFDYDTDDHRLAFMRGYIACAVTFADGVDGDIADGPTWSKGDDVTDENTIVYQREYWDGMLRAEAEQAERQNDWRTLGLAWGDPESSQAVDSQGRELGDYSSVLRRLHALVTPFSTVLELGSYGGKWTQYVLHARAIRCFDLTWTSCDVMCQRFGSGFNMYYHVTKGYDLKGAEDASIDVVFSMDSLVRAPLDSIGSYLREFHRVLRPGGHVLVHLPWDDSPGSRERNFTRLNRRWLLAHTSQFSRADLDETTLKHGLLLHLVK